MTLKLVIAILFLFNSNLFAQNSTADSTTGSTTELFEQGLKFYQAGNFESAENHFQQALQLQPNNASLLYNLGLSEYRAGKTGPAMASWRKALELDPSFDDARLAIKFAHNKLEHKELPHEVMLLETLRSSYLQWVSFNQALFLFCLTLFAFGWVGIKYLGQRKSSRETERPPPSIPAPLIILCFSFLLVCFLSSAKVVDLLTPRATVLPKTLEVRAGPDQGQASLFELYEGLEVLVDDVQNEWIKVTYPGGRSGWVPSTSVQRTK